jgi:hypothetical protein
MPHWLIKSAIHHAISWLPERQFWNGLLQTYVTRSTQLTSQMFEEKLSQCRHFVDDLRSVRPGATGFRVLEVGTGWFPTVPVGLYLCGAMEIWTVDIDPLLRADRIRGMLEYYRDYERGGHLKKWLPDCRPDRLQAALALLAEVEDLPPAALLEQLKIHVIVGDAQRTGLPPKSIDFFFSNGVLEYIPRPILAGILEEARRLAAPGAVMSHRLNLIDQFSYFDQSITPYNFLRYTSDQWRWRNSPLIWQNRLRISDYRTLLNDAGFQVVREENVSGKSEDLKGVKLAPEFHGYRNEDLIVLHSFLLARFAEAESSSGAPSSP